MKRILTVLLAFGLCVSASAASFTDTQTHWAKESIDYVVDRGLFNGTSESTFSPELTMDRAMLCTVLYRYAGSPATGGACRFTDVAQGKYYYDAMAWAQNKAIIPWWMCDDPTIRPNEGVSRAEFASMMFNFYRYFKGLHFGDCNADFQALYPDLLVKGQAENWDILNRDLAWAYSYGILNGTTANTMSPLMTVTRAQIATILQRFDNVFMKSGSFVDCEPTVKVPASTKVVDTTKPEEPKTDNKYGIDYGYVQTEEEMKVEEELIQLINDYRVENGLEPLVKSEVLMECADIRALEIQKNYSHTRPNGENSSTVCLGKDGYGYTSGENIVASRWNAQDAFDAWKNSPGHNNLMLNENLKTIGIGYTKFGGCFAMETSSGTDLQLNAFGCRATRCF